MWAQPTTPYAEAIGEGLTLRTPAAREDVERLAAFNAAVHGAILAPMTHRLLIQHPDMEPADQVYVENRDGEIVSALCLIPWTWNCEGARLRAGELGIVGTAEEYRGRGLIRRQMAYFMRRLHERECVISHIQGIPNFYRQFGYDYALPLEGGYRLELRHAPAPQTSSFALRAADSGDIPMLACMYGEAARELCFHTERSDAIWRYLLECKDPADGMFHDTWQAHENEAGEVGGYMRIPHYHFGEELVINEAYAARHEAAVALLDHAKKVAEKRRMPGIRLSLPASSYLVRLAQACGAAAMGTYAWQIHIPDPAALLRAMRPALEARLARSPFCAWSGTLRIGMYRRALALHFERGTLQIVDGVDARAEADVLIPYAAFVPLVLSYRTLAELRDQYPDVNADREYRLLLETLFPKRNSFLFTVY